MAEDRKKLAIFDFCGTIYKHQSADIFADFASKRGLRTSILDSICNILVTRPKYSGLIHKKVKLLQLKGTTASYLEEKAKEFVEKQVFPELIDIVAKELDKYIADPGFDVVIASAGYDVYLKYFCDVKNIPFLVATNIEMKNGRATGKMNGYDCFGREKVKRLNKLITLKNYDLANSVCFSDSLTDKPIFELTGKKYFVKQFGNEYSIIHIDNAVFNIF
ncbi:HAD-IB family hydrolase [Flavipsychrobacter stenotrophus]|uniref:HAD-IB family hydrolase n=1 Tax=Flavipsychrobacter stenotrophus TaxID=2077091 RepID=A0A2S7SXI2_9BACT|nr:HAD-IB family hydrolase [Flavipsychrobacter stenotrophus]PQJ11642.1 HAD-IB family hydrolase [Flavipsychrobacter stenotrophus]